MAGQTHKGNGNGNGRSTAGARRVSPRSESGQRSRRAGDRVGHRHRADRRDRGRRRRRADPRARRSGLRRQRDDRVAEGDRVAGRIGRGVDRRAGRRRSTNCPARSNRCRPTPPAWPRRSPKPPRRRGNQRVDPVGARHDRGDGHRGAAGRHSVTQMAAATRTISRDTEDLRQLGHRDGGGDRGDVALDHAWSPTTPTISPCRPRKPPRRSTRWRRRSSRSAR